MALMYRILRLNPKTIIPEIGEPFEVPVVEGLDVVHQLPGAFSVCGRESIPVPGRNGRTVKHMAEMTRIPGTDDYAAFSEDFSEIDPGNEGKSLLQYGRSNWPWWGCDVVVDTIDGEPVVSKVLVVLSTVPVADASIEKPWTVNGQDAAHVVHSLPSQSMPGMIDMIEKASIRELQEV